MYNFFFTCQLGLEELLKQEIKSIGIDDSKITLTSGGVELYTQLEDAYNVMLWSHIAAHSLVHLQKSHVEDDIDLYNSALSVNWLKILEPFSEIMIDFHGTNKNLRNSHYNALRVKDAICDHYVRNGQERPTINTDNPDAIIHVRFHKDKLNIYLDLSGTMHKRYRQVSGKAPIRETLAASMIYRSNWDTQSPVVDPMCGSGVLLIESCLIALKRAPGLLREKHYMNAWTNFDNDKWQQAILEAKKQALTSKVNFKAYGSDVDYHVIQTAKENALRAGVSEFIQWSIQDIEDVRNLSNKTKGLVITNPPYGIRLGSVSSLMSVYQLLGRVIKSNFPGFIFAVISSEEKLLSCLGLSATKTWKIKNANLDCLFKIYGISDRTLRLEKEELQQLDSNISKDVKKLSSEPLTLEEKINNLNAKSLYDRLGKNYKKISKFLNRDKIEAYRIYDADIPEYNISVDVYKDYYLVYEYAAPKTIDSFRAHKRLLDAIEAVRLFSGLPAQNIILKQRDRQKGKNQYQVLDNKELSLIIEEYGVKLKVNLTDYLDTGVFLDHRSIRKLIQQQAKDKNFLNLFAYTASATLHAILGGAKKTLSVDMSNTYCHWASYNYDLNNIKGNQHRILQANVLEWIDDAITDNLKFDFIFIDPPTFSNSKNMKDSFDVQRDHVDLLTKLYKLLSDEGTILFSNNKRGFKLDQNSLEELDVVIRDITKDTMPDDFRDLRIHQAWMIRKV